MDYYYPDPALVQQNNWLMYQNQMLQNTVNSVIFQLQRGGPTEHGFYVVAQGGQLFCQYCKGNGIIPYPFADFILFNVKKIVPVPLLNYDMIIQIECYSKDKIITFSVKQEDFNIDGLYKSLVNAGLSLNLIRKNNLKFSKELFFSYFVSSPCYKNANIVYVQVFLAGLFNKI